MTFMNKVIQGVETMDSANNYVEDWSKNHSNTIGLHEFLGMTKTTSDSELLENLTRRSRLQTISNTPVSTLYA